MRACNAVLAAWRSACCSSDRYCGAGIRTYWDSCVAPGDAPLWNVTIPRSAWSPLAASHRWMIGTADELGPVNESRSGNSHFKNRSAAGVQDRAWVHSRTRCRSNELDMPSDAASPPLDWAFPSESPG